MKQSTASPASSPLVSIVILNWNEGQRIQRCLEHVFQQTYDSLEVIVVDNGSTDGSTDAVARLWGDKITIVRSPQNVGFPQGMNLGIVRATGKYLLLLNADLYLDPNFLSRAVALMEGYSEERVGMLSAIVYVYHDGRNTEEIDMAGVLLQPYHTMVCSPNTTKPELVLGPAGSAMFVSQAMLKDVRLRGGDYLDSSYFMYGEDLELFLRGQLLGWRCLFQPLVVGWHEGSAAVGAKSFINKPDSFQVHAIKNRFATILTCYPFSLWLWTLPWNLLSDMGTVGLAVATGRWRLLRNWCRAVGITIRRLPDLLRKRHWLMSRRQVSSHYLRRLYIRQRSWEILRGLIAKA